MMNEKVLIKNIRNFCIIAHINHGKSTLSNKIIDYCNKSLFYKKINFKLLDNMDIEKEKGITIKSKNITLNYLHNNNILYKFNLIDTPGHTDFFYEVYKIFNICNGALLVIDSTKGIQAQTLSSYYLAKDNNLKIIYVLNKIDLLSSNIKKIICDLKYNFNIKESDYVLCSSKTGYGINKLINKIINFIPNPKIEENNNLKAIIIDIKFDNYLGIIFLLCIKSGCIKKGFLIKVSNNNNSFLVNKLGIFSIKNIFVDSLNCGDIGWISCLEKKIFNISIGNIVTLFKHNNTNIIKENKIEKINSKIYASLFLYNSNEFNKFKQSMLRYSLSDLSLNYEEEYSSIFGFGFRCGFLGFLHMEVVKKRLEKEFNLNLIYTTPNVEYKILTNNNEIIYINNLNKIYNYNIKEISEPISICNIITPYEYIGKIIKLCFEKRGSKVDTINKEKYIELVYYIPVSEIIINFFENIKSISNGYASINYKFDHFKKSDLFIMEVMINKNLINELVFIVHKKNIKSNILDINNKLSKLLFRKQFNIIIQILINKKIVSKYVIKQFRKNVIDKCYGGDVSRKKKLLNKQKIGKKKMNKINSINIELNIIKSLLKI